MNNLLTEGEFMGELIEMIVQNSMSYLFSLADFYDRFETQLQFLETFGVTTGNSAAILCPLIEVILYVRRASEDLMTSLTDLHNSLRNTIYVTHISDSRLHDEITAQY